MPDAPQMHAYIVCLSYADNGPILADTCIAPSEIAALAMSMDAWMRRDGVPAQKLYGVAVRTLHPDFLRAAVRAVEGKPWASDHEAQVLALVPNTRLPASVIGEGRTVYSHEFGPPAPGAA